MIIVIMHHVILKQDLAIKECFEIHFNIIIESLFKYLHSKKNSVIDDVALGIKKKKKKKDMF